MEIKDSELYYITDEKERYYLTGFKSTDGYVLLSRGVSEFVVDERYFAAARERLADSCFTVVCGRGDGELKRILENGGYKTLGVSFANTTVIEFEKLKSLCVEIRDISDELASIAEIKSASELNQIKKACKAAEKAFIETIAYLKVGVTERDIAAELEYRFRKNGASGASFDTIVAFGKNSAVPHHETSNTSLKENRAVLIDFGCVVNGYCSDITRTLFFGEPSEAFIKDYNLVLTAKRLAQKNITSGMSGREAHKIAKDYLDKNKVGAAFTHSLGHGIGLHIHEKPYLSPKSEEILRDGNVFSIEPGIYFNGRYGIRIEDTVTLCGGKVERLSRLMDKLTVIG